MRTFRITNGFNELSDAYLIVRATFIKSSLTGNASFPQPVPSLTDLGASIDAFSNAVQAAEGGSRQDIAVKNSLRETLVNQLHLLGNYVLFTAAGDEVVATSSGYNISKQPTPQPPITSPDGVALANGINRGELELSCKKVAGARSYVHELTPWPVTADSQWQSVPSTSIKNLFTGLDSGKEYAGRVTAIGVKQQVVYSDVVSKIAL